MKTEDTKTEETASDLRDELLENLATAIDIWTQTMAALRAEVEAQADRWSGDPGDLDGPEMVERAANVSAAIANMSWASRMVKMYSKLTALDAGEQSP